MPPFVTTRTSLSEQLPSLPTDPGESLALTIHLPPKFPWLVAIDTPATFCMAGTNGPISQSIHMVREPLSTLLNSPFIDDHT